MGSNNPESQLLQESQSTLSTDAIQVHARPHQTSSSPSETEQNAHEIMNTNTSLRTGNILDPPMDWRFNVFLSKLEDGLSTEELTKMKRLFEGDGGIGRGVLEKIQTPTDLFRILRTRGYISRDNLLYLQAMLFWAGRKDLVEEAVEFSKTIGEVLHFYAASNQPENGYKYVKFHIDGKDFKNYRRCDIDNLRRTVSTLLFVPSRYIFVCGIEPSSSLIVTLMIPEMYVDILNNLLNDSENFADLHKLGVDAIELDEKTVFLIKGVGQDLACNSDQQAKFVNIYEQLKQTKVRLEAAEDEYLQLSHQLGLLQSKVNESEENLEKSKSQVENLTRLLSLSGDESQPATLEEVCFVKLFTEALNQINLEPVDKKVIQRLIDATVGVVAKRVTESHRIQEQRMLLDLQDMQSRLDPLMFELNKYKFLTDVSNIDQAVLDSFKYLLLSMIESALITEAEWSSTQHVLQVMKKLSNKLRLKEKEKLKQKYDWVPGGRIEKFMEDDQNMFFAGLFLKEVEQRKALVDPEKFMSECLTEVNREDLKKNLDKKPSPNPSSQKYAADTRHHQEEKYRKKGRYHKQQQQEVPLQDHQFQQHLDNQTVLMTKMAQQVQEMYGMLQAKREEYAPKYEPWKSCSFNPQSFPQNQTL